jgi:predicted nucleic acid-binding protein
MTTRVFLDTCIVIDLVEGRPEQQVQLESLILGKQVLSSELVQMEPRLQAVRDKRDDLLAVYDSYFANYELVPFDRTMFDLATRLRIDHRIKTPDALHLAAALMSGCHQERTWEGLPAIRVRQLLNDQPLPLEFPPLPFALYPVERV